MASWSSSHWECLMHERNVSSDSNARKPRKLAPAKRPKITPELLAQYINSEATGYTVADAPAFTKLPPEKKLTATDNFRSSMISDPSLHGRWLVPDLYSQNLPRHFAQKVMTSWRNAKPETYGAAPGSSFEVGADPSPQEPNTWIIKVKYNPAPAVPHAVD